LAEGTGPAPDDAPKELRELPIEAFLLSTAATLASLAYGKLGAGELDEARLAIDALRALVPVLEGGSEAEAARAVGQAVANLQLAYASAVAAAPSPDE
jgi:hypothetical protein